MKNNKKKTRMTKIEKRRLAFEKRNVKKEQNLARYGSEGGSALVMAKTTEFNRRMLAALLALVFVLTSVIVGYNIATKAQGHDEGGYGMMETVDDETGMVLRKGYAVTDKKDPKNPDDDVYSLRLEAYSTKDTTQIPLDTNDQKTPLDIVMVLDQSSSMTTNKDVLTGGYAPIENKTSFKVSEAEGKYYKVTDAEGVHYYEIFAERSPNESDYVIVTDNQKNAIETWTAQDAHDKKQELNQDLYYKNGDTFETVRASQEIWYKNAGTLSFDDFIDANFFSFSDYGYRTNNTMLNKYFYNSEGDTTANKPFWHQVYCNTTGFNRLYESGFYADLWYYTQSKTGNSIAYSSSATRYSQAYRDALGNNTISRIPASNSDSNHGDYEALKYDYSVSHSSVKYTDGKLYVEKDPDTGDNGYNRLVTLDNNGAEARELAWQLAQTSSAASAGNPGSSTWGSASNPGYLYTAGYKLYYLDGNGTKHEVDNCTSVYGKDEVTFNGTLYDWERMTRLEAQQLAANEFAEQIAANIGEREYRIAVVGNAGTGTIYSGTKAADGAFVETTEEVKSAIDDLTAAQATGTNLSAGLTKAGEVFAANKLKPADSRKRITILFGDSDTWESTSNNNVNTRTEDAKLKDTYNSTVYTIGLFNGGTTTAEQFMKEMSSEYFSSYQNPTSYKQMDGTYHYLADSNVFPDETNSIISTFGTVAKKSVTSPTTEFVLDNITAFLKDVIHKNFNLPTDETKVKVATGTYNDGVLTWGSEDDAPGNITATWSSEEGETEDRVLTVKGFDYDANYVSPDRTGSSGQKIIVTIDGLTVNQRVRTESKSAKRIYFNTAASGIYKDGAEELVVNKFPRPFLDDKTMLAPAGGTGTMSDDGVVVNKYLTPTENGTYDLTVEAYTTQTSTTETEKIPTDFIVVADQSGSMDIKDMPTDYKPVSGTKTLKQIMEGQYFIKGDDGNYYRVYGTRDYLYRYYPANYWYVGDLISRFGTRLGWFMGETGADTTFSNQMYFREEVNGKTYYQPITMSVKGVPLTYYISFQYNSADPAASNPVRFNRDNTTYSNNGNSPWYRNFITGAVMKQGFVWSSTDGIVQTAYRDDYQYTFSKAGSITTGMYVNYPMYDRHVGYTKLGYRDTNGTEHFLKATTGQETFEFCDGDGNALTSQNGAQPSYSGLYEATGYQTRLEALQNALTEFAQAVASEKNSNDQPVDNRIAIVGFSSPGFNNTELLTHQTESINFNASWTSPSGSSSSEYSNDGNAHDGVQKTTADGNEQYYYGGALVSAYDANTTDKVNQKITDGIRALTAHGGTQPEDGLVMAKKILENRTDKTYRVQTGSEHPEVDRHTIVIYFTDGRPGDYTTSNQYSEANDVVEAAKDIKILQNSTVNNTHPSVFSIGVFGESDGNPLTYNETNLVEPYNDSAYWEYMGGYVETYESNGSKYCLRRQWRPGNAEYTDVANDTIFDYMSVTSSNYPDANNYIAPEWLSGNFNGNYVAATDGSSVRSKDTALASNDYYRMASNQATLVAAFAQAVTMTSETISEDQRLDAAAVMQDVFNNTNFTVQDGYSIRATTVDGSMDRYGTVNFKEETEAPATGVITKLEKVGDNQNQTVTVTGFDYLANYINYGTEAIPQHDGKKLVVTISNVVPTMTGDKFFSNIFSDENHESAMYIKDNAVNGTDFPTPAISRHKYTLEVGDVNPNATFTVSMKVLDGSGNEVAKDANSLADVILVYPNGTRKLYSEVGPQEFLQVAGGQSFYLENLPSGYQVETKVTSTDDAYEYFIWFDGDDNASNPKKMNKGKAETKIFDYADRTIHITSKRGSKDVSIRERTIGSYGDTTHRFGEVITMEIPVVTGETLKTEFDCTFNDNFSGFEYGLPKNADSYKAVFTVQNPDATDTKVAMLTAINYTNRDGTPGTWTLPKNSELQSELPMRDGDEIIFKDVPTGNTVKAHEPDTYEHEVFYYYGQDDVSPSGIKLMTSNGDLLSGTHTLKLKNVDGLETDLLEVTFVDGSITEVGGQAVDANTVIDFAKYETIYVIDDDLSDAKLNIDGTDVYFDTETQDDQTAYVATIKRQTNRPPVSVTVEKNNMDILIVNERGDIEIEGIFDNNHHTIIYILSGAGALALAAGGYYVWKKKDEFVEE